MREMAPSNFIRKVDEYAGLRNLETALNLTKMVFYLLSARLTIKEGEDLAAQLPKDVRAVWDEVGEKEVDVIKFDKKEFLGKLKSDAGLRSDEGAELIVKAVFKAIKEQVSRGESRDVEAQLPKDLKKMWADA